MTGGSAEHAASAGPGALGDVWARAGAAMATADLTTLEGCREVSRIYDRAVREERRLRLGLPVDPKTASGAAPLGGG